MKPMPRRKGSRSRSDIPADVLADLNAGRLETATLAEGLAVDFTTLLRAAAPTVPTQAVATVLPTLGIVQRMQHVGRFLFEHLGMVGFATLSHHPSDTVRGWSAYMLAVADLKLPTLLRQAAPLADDPHFGVREWAWLALRPQIAADLPAALRMLQPWTEHASANRRRFAVEITRPRGVWCSHIADLKANPELGMPLLEPVRSDPTKYVQDSAANWLNDAAKSQPDWVRRLCRRWLKESKSPATERICHRAQRSL